MTLVEKIQRSLSAVSIKVFGQWSNLEVSTGAFTRVDWKSATALLRLSAFIAVVLAIITSERKGLTSIVVLLIDINCAVSALVPEPPKGSIMCSGRKPNELIAAATNSGENASLK